MPVDCNNLLTPPGAKRQLGAVFCAVLALVVLAVDLPVVHHHHDTPGLYDEVQARSGRSATIVPGFARMGTFTVKVALSHPERPANQITLELLVDRGATWSLIPAEAARALNVQPLETRSVKTADGRRLELPLTEVRFTMDGRSLTTPSLIGAPDAPALLGAVTLEAFGLAADPVQKILVPVTGLLL